MTSSLSLVLTLVARGEMHLPWIILSQGSDHLSSGSSSIVTLSYIVGSIAAIMGIVGGFYRFYGKQKQKWIEDGAARAEASQTLRRYTESVDELGKKLDDFTVAIKSELSKVSDRVTHLEKRRPSGG
jgi:hypothetical protein